VGPVDAGEKWMCSVCVQGCYYLASSSFAVSEKFGFWLIALLPGSYIRRFLTEIPWKNPVNQ